MIVVMGKKSNVESCEGKPEETDNMLFPRYKTMVHCCLEQCVVLVLPSWRSRRLCGRAEERAASLDQLPWEEQPSGLWPGKKVAGDGG